MHVVDVGQLSLPSEVWTRGVTPPVLVVTLPMLGTDRDLVPPLG